MNTKRIRLVFGKKERNRFGIMEEKKEICLEKKCPDYETIQFPESCLLCPRECNVDRLAGKTGRCHVDAGIKVARAALHMWEEPCISGTEGSGTVFFSGCSLGCIYCQNRAISGGKSGLVISEERLAEIFLELQEQKANNINLVTAGHYVPQVCNALRLAKTDGLTIPVVYNSSGYEKAQTIKMLEGLVDIYLPDFKYMETTSAKQYSKAADYPEVAKAAIREMVRQQPIPHFDERGMLTAGVVVRHLLLPGHVKEAKRIISYLHETYGEQIYISMMNQYTPVEEVLQDKLLGRRVTKREYERLLDHAGEIGITQGFYQEGKTAMESFIPPFDCQGVLKKTSGIAEVKVNGKIQELSQSSIVVEKKNEKIQEA